MSSFFTVPGAGKKLKRAAAPGPESTKRRRITTSSSRALGKAPAKPAAAAKKKAVQRDESISGSDSDEFDDADDLPDHSGSEDDSDASGGEATTAAERRLRLAERYLENVRQEVDEYGFDAEEIDKDLIADRLQEDVAESKGKLYRALANELDLDQATQCFWGWNSDTVTSVATCGPYTYTVSKDSYLTKFKLQDLPQHQWPQTTRKKQKKPQAPPRRRPERVAFRRGNPQKAKDKSFQGHVGPILSVAASQDGKYVATGGQDSRLVLWDAEKLTPLRTFFQHRDAVTGLAWRKGTNQLYSASKDRSVKVWSMDEQAYIETLFGHQDAVVDIDALAQERCLTVGSRDRTARLWKVVEETQLVFRGGSTVRKDKSGVDPKSLALEGSIDRVAMLDDQLFVTGGDSGSITLWAAERKKPVFILHDAHGFDLPVETTAASAEQASDQKSVLPPPLPRWITALKTIPFSDLILSGSWEGCVRIWRISADKKRIEAVGILGKAIDQEEPAATNGIKEANGVNGTHTHDSNKESAAGKPIKGVINDIAVFERGDRGKDGLSVVCGVGKDHRLGRWQKVPGGRNGGVVFEVPRIPKNAKGVQSSSED